MGGKKGGTVVVLMVVPHLLLWPLLLAFNTLPIVKVSLQVSRAILRQMSLGSLAMG